MCSATPRQAFRSEPILLIFARKNKEKHRNATDARPFGQGEYSALANPPWGKSRAPYWNLKLPDANFEISLKKMK